jgi:hypothetical protein
MMMNTMVRDTEIEMALPLHDASAPGQEARRRRVRWSAAGPVGIVLLSGVTLFVLGQRAASPEVPAALPAYEAAAPAEGIATMPSAPVDGVLEMVIPPGAAADQQAGGRGYVMPSRIDLEVGDTIVIRNDDDAPHMILYTFLMPGESHERTFTEPGSEVYSSGCGLHAAAILNFTSIFVSEPGASGAAA